MHTKNSVINNTKNYNGYAIKVNLLLQVNGDIYFDECTSSNFFYFNKSMIP